MISCIILTKNEAEHISDCLKSVLWCDELIVIDDHSTDDTVAQAKSLGAIVYFHDLERDFAAQRNFGLTKARGDWVLFVDADERVNEDLRKEIQEMLARHRNRYRAYRIPRTDVLWGREMHHGEAARKQLVRLGRKDSGTWTGHVHEVWEIEGHVSDLTGVLLHYPHQTVREFLAEINFYTDLRAEELKRHGVKSSWWSILFYTKAKFFQNYILRLGILDGLPGLIVAIMMSFHSFLVRSKLWLLWHKK